MREFEINPQRMEMKQKSVGWVQLLAGASQKGWEAEGDNLMSPSKNDPQKQWGLVGRE
jgi:hypothetical protein